MTTIVPADVVTVRARGRVSADEVAYARSKVAAVTRYVRDPVLFARVKLTRLADPGVAQRAVVQANLDLNGRLLRAQVARPTMREAVDEVHDRLRDRVQRAAGRWEATRVRHAHRGQGHRRATGEGASPPVVSRGSEDRQIVRHKTFTLQRVTVDEAAYEMEMLDYDFHLFTEWGTAVDSVLHRPAVGRGYRLIQLDPAPREIARGLVPVTVSTARPPTLSVDAAARQLDALGWPFLFFRDVTTGRGCVLYHRYDRHLGLITPPGHAPGPPAGEELG